MVFTEGSQIVARRPLRCQSNLQVLQGLLGIQTQNSLFFACKADVLPFAMEAEYSVQFFIQFTLGTEIVVFFYHSKLALTQQNILFSFAFFKLTHRERHF